MGRAHLRTPTKNVFLPFFVLPSVRTTISASFEGGVTNRRWSAQRVVGHVAKARLFLMPAAIWAMFAVPRCAAGTSRPPLDLSSRSSTAFRASASSPAAFYGRHYFGTFRILQVRLDLIVSGVERLDRRWVLGASSAKRLDAHPFCIARR